MRTEMCAHVKDLRYYAFYLNRGKMVTTFLTMHKTPEKQKNST